LEKRAYVYICGDAKSMAKSVEEELINMLGAARGGGLAEGQKELKLLKDRNVSVVGCGSVAVWRG
jgi:NADPH-ferrihemoprotein reductase